MTEIEVTTKTQHYQVNVAHGNLQRLAALVQQVWQPRKVAVITDTNVGPLYADDVVRQLSRAGFMVTVLTVPAGEASKGWAQLERLVDALSQAHFSRGDGVVALGGGVVGDLAGFVAAVYMRGIHLIQVPTSLLAQVDSSVGGKTAIDLPSGKNLVGSFYQPDLVVIDPQTLQSLPVRMLVEGYGEIVKCAALVGGPFWQQLQLINAPAAILANAETLIERSVAFKARVVQADEHEGGQRQLLNLGHTVGHAVELLGRGRYMHGEAVAIGLVAVSRIFAAHGLIPATMVTALSERLAAVGLPTTLPKESARAVIDVMRHDKKVHGAALTWVYVSAPGKPAMHSVALTDLPAWIAPLGLK